jgi:hypothetical protein
MAVYRSEVHIPVQKDSLSFQDRQIKQWNVEERMEERRKQWQVRHSKSKSESKSYERLVLKCKIIKLMKSLI